MTATTTASANGSAPASTTEEKVAEATIKLVKIERATIQVRVVGTTPLICHRFDEKAKGMMLDAQQGRKKAKVAKDPQADFERSLYRLPDGSFGFPATGFKAATVDAARYFQGVKMTELRQALLFHGVGPEQLVQIEGDPVMREDTVRVGMGVADLRYRAMFETWAATLTITYVPTLLDASSVVTLIDAGGTGGIGEWRPSKAKTGSYGTYEVDAESFDEAAA